MDNTFDDMSYLNWLSHIGVDHLHGNPGSGRYPYGSGKHGKASLRRRCMPGPSGCTQNGPLSK